MKNYRITVNGNVYDVIVEEGASAGILAAAPQAAIPHAASQAPAAAPQAAAPAPGNSGAAGGLSVTAPMPGKILGVKASVGQSVKKGDVLIILEAMKMENEIVAPSDGIIATINVSNGDSVEAGKTLATLN